MPFLPNTVDRLGAIADKHATQCKKLENKRSLIHLIEKIKV